MSARYFPNIEFGPIPLKNVYFQCVLWSLIASLAVGQDYINAFINNGHFYLSESLAYKLFWLLFIPFSLAWIYGLDRTRVYSKRLAYFPFLFIVMLVASIIHLIVFATLLFVISNIIHIDTWNFSWLLNEKLSTRLYVVIIVYVMISLLYFWIYRSEQDKKVSNDVFRDQLTVRVGQKLIIIKVDDIKWISSVGSYIAFHTNTGKYLSSESLKSISQVLNPDNFKRIHRSTIANLALIKELKSRLNGDYDVILLDGTTLRLSRNYKSSLKGILI